MIMTELFMQHLGASDPTLQGPKWSIAVLTSFASNCRMAAVPELNT
jgi:hypothetical protein